MPPDHPIPSDPKDNSATGFLIVGSGGHAGVVVSTLRALGLSMRGLLDERPSLHGKRAHGCEVLGSSQLLQHHHGPAIIAIGKNARRLRVAHQWPDTSWTTAIHPHAWVAPSAVLGPGTVIFAGAVVQPGAVLGAHCVVNTGATVDHDCRLDDFVHVGPGAHLSGSVTLGQGVFAGTGSCITPGRTVGSWTTIGAGATVIRDLDSNVVAVGVPAKPIKTRDENWHLED